MLQLEEAQALYPNLVEKIKVEDLMDVVRQTEERKGVAAATNVRKSFKALEAIAYTSTFENSTSYRRYDLSVLSRVIFSLARRNPDYFQFLSHATHVIEETIEDEIL